MNNQQLFDGCLVISPYADLHEVTADLPGTAGVSLFTNQDNLPILLLCGANLRRQVRRRLAQDKNAEKTRRPQLRPVVRRIWFRRTYSAFETQWAYFHITRALYPDKYHEFFPGLEVWFLQVQPQAEWPFFAVTNQLGPGGNLYWGPFAAKKHAGSFLEIIQDIFNLCRCPHLLGATCEAGSCPYAQMNRCAAVHEGKVSAVQYRQVVNQAMDFLNRGSAETIDELRQKMKRLSADLKFEQAQQVKKQIEKGRKLLAPNYRWVMPLERFFVLAFQDGPALKIPYQRRVLPSISPYLIGPGWIKQIEPAPVNQTREIARQILDHYNLYRLEVLPRECSCGAMELFAWVTGQLYRSTCDKGLFLPAREDLDAEVIDRKLQEKFARPRAGKMRNQDHN